MNCQKRFGKKVRLSYSLILLYDQISIFLGHNFSVFANVGSVNFIKYLINSIVFQNGLMSKGRPELFLIMPPPLYIVSNKSLGFYYMN